MNREFRWDIAHNAKVYQRGTGFDDYREFIDFTAGIFAVNTGHANNRIEREIRVQMALGLTHAYTYGTEIRERYEQRLCEWTGYEACHLFTTGSEAVEAAMRVMWKRHPSQNIFGISDCFHGKTSGPRLIINKVNYWPDTTASHWIIEGYRGWDAHFWGKGFIRHLKNCQEMGFLICFDEVQSGFGRTGRKFAYEWYGISPDILVIGKGSHSGFPGSAILASRQLLDSWREEFSSTHGGNPLACAAGLATIEEFERLNLIEEAARKGEILHGKLNSMAVDGLQIRGRGMVAAILTDSTSRADNIILSAREKGLLLVHTGKASVKIGPPLTIPDQVLEEGVEILKGVLDEI